MKVFSFSLYGNKPKYIRGMHENIKTISDVFPDWKIIIYYEEESVDIEQFKTYPNVILRKGEYNGNRLRLDRFKPIDDHEVEIMMVRDADSRINARDEWCIREFIKSPKLFHIIRDHPYHTTHVMAGLWGIKQGCIPKFIKITDMVTIFCERPDRYGSDQDFLSEILYPKVAEIALIHGSVKMNQYEKTIDIPINIPHVFCGQAIEYDEYGKEYHNCEDCKAMNIAY